MNTWVCRGCGKTNFSDQRQCGAGEWDGCGGCRAEYETKRKSEIQSLYRGKPISGLDAMASAFKDMSVAATGVAFGKIPRSRITTVHVHYDDETLSRGERHNPKCRCFLVDLV